MRKTNIWKRGGTAMMVMAGLGLTTPIVTTVVAAETDVGPDAETAVAVLRLRPETLDPKIEKEMNRLRAAISAGELPVKAIAEWPGMRSGHMRVKIMASGNNDAVIYDIDGAPLAGEDINVRLASIAPLIETCTAHAKSSQSADYYKMPEGSTGRIYNATCTPVVKAKESKEVSIDEKIALLMADEDISIETRKARARGMKAGSLNRAYKAKYPNPTREQESKHCVESFTILDEGYNFHNTPKMGPDKITETCDKIILRDFGPVDP